MFYKKALLILATLMLSIIASPTVNAENSATSGSCGDNVKWDLDTSTGALTISGIGDMTDYTDDPTAPWYSNKNSIKSVSIGNGVTSVGSNAFNDCSRLTSVNIPNSVVKVGAGAFCNCISLTSITIPPSVEGIGVLPFYNCTGLTSIKILGNLNSLMYNMFWGCTGLNSIELNRVDRIQIGTFRDCKVLKHFTYAGMTEPLNGGNVFSSDCPLKAVNVPSYYVGNTFCNMPVIKAPTNKFTSFSESVYEKILYLLKFCQFSIAFLM